jgi:hypothetical protein
MSDGALPEDHEHAKRWISYRRCCANHRTNGDFLGRAAAASLYAGEQRHDDPEVVVFDDEAKTLQAQSGPKTYRFSDVSISNVAISGDAGAVSVGIDRSSLGMVWQRYTSEKPTIEYGQCQKTAASAAGH